MSELQRETAFLKDVILYDDSGDRHELEKSIEQVQRDRHCVERVAWVLALSLLMVIAGVVYGMVLQESFPYNLPEVVFRLLCELGLALLACLMAFAVLLAVYHLKLNRLREECRQLVKKLLELHLGKPHTSATIKPGPRSPN